MIRCLPPAEAVDGAAARWDKRLAAAPWAEPRAGWRDELQRLAADADGVVLSLEIVRQARIRQHRKPWSLGRLDATRWEARPDTLLAFARYAGRSCDAYEGALPLLSHDVDEPVAPAPQDWPPRTLPGLLDVVELQPLPARYAALVTR